MHVNQILVLQVSVDFLVSRQREQIVTRQISVTNNDTYKAKKFFCTKAQAIASMPLYSN